MSGINKSYTCPMHPEIQSNDPGTCSKCGMALVKNGKMEAQHNREMNHEDHHRMMEKDFKKRFFIILPITIIIMLLSPNIQKWMGFSISFPLENIFVLTIATFVFFVGGKPFFNAAKDEIRSKNLGMMTLVSIAVIVGYAFSVAATFLFNGESMYWEISTLILVFLLGHWLEMRAVRGTTGALAELAKLIPPLAHLIKNGNVIDIETEKIVIGDKVLVKPGEKIPVDGIVREGESSINEAMITGESMPITKIKGDKVIGGTINQDGSLTIEVTKTGKDTAISQIIELVKKAQSSKPNIQHLADKAASVLTVVAIIAGVISFVSWLFVSPHGAVFAATLAVSAIVVACPHALGLAIPTVTTITSTLGAKNGILIKDMKGLEIVRKVNYVVFDKTGTLTEGKFGVRNIVLSKNTNFSEKELLQLTAAVEVNSQHSIGAGIVIEAKKQGLEIPEVSDFKSYPGKGASGKVNGKKITVGNNALIQELGFKDFDLNVENNGTTVYIGIDRKVEGAMVLQDQIREDSKQTIQRLHEMGIKTAILTGDTQDIAKKVGEQLKIDTVFAQVLPKDKVNKVKELQSKGNIVAMVGDGVNDAPSLTQAHVGIAIGAGTDVAVESAEIVLMKNDPLDVVRAIALSRKTNSKMTQNLIWATGYNVFAIPIAAGILYPSFGILLKPEWAALLMSASSIIVVFNALLLRRTKL